MANKSPKDPRNRKHNGARKWQGEYLQEFVDKEKDRVNEKNKTESIEDFLARGGEIKTYAYKWPPCWKMTFNGSKAHKKNR